MIPTDLLWVSVFKHIGRALMGACTSTSADTVKGTLKIILLGTQGTGKSTFHKQMRIIYSPDGTQDEIASSKGMFAANLLLGLKDLAALIEDNGVKVSSKAMAVRLTNVFVGKIRADFSLEFLQAAEALNSIPNVYDIALESPILINVCSRLVL